MKKEAFVKNIMDYFTDVEWTTTNTKKLNALTDELVNSITSIVPKEKIVYVDKLIFRTVYADKVVEKTGVMATHRQLSELAQEVCDRYGMSMRQLKSDSDIDVYEGFQRRRTNYVEARAEFVNEALTVYPNTTYQSLTDFLGYKHHSSIIHLRYYRKYESKKLKAV